MTTDQIIEAARHAQKRVDEQAAWNYDTVQVAALGAVAFAFQAFADKLEAAHQAVSTDQYAMNGGRRDDG